MAVIESIQLFVTGANVALMIPNGLLGNPAPHLPAHVINGICDAGGFQGTRYGGLSGHSGVPGADPAPPGPPPPEGSHPEA